MRKIQLSDETAHRLNNGFDIRTGPIRHIDLCGRNYTDTRDLIRALKRLARDAVSDQKQEAFQGLAELLEKASKNNG